jgi:hypothetical protein
MVLEKKQARFDGVVYEDAVVELRDFLQECAPEPVTFDFSECDDLHMAVIQTILAYRKLYACTYRFGAPQRVYRKVIEGFDADEDDCRQ